MSGPDPKDNIAVCPQCLTEMVRRNQIALSEARARAVNKDLFGG